MWNPRIGGEKILEPSMGVGNFGSPPHRRGKDSLPDVDCIIRRITPHRRGKASAYNSLAETVDITPAQAGKSS